MTSIENLLSRLEKVRKVGGGWSACCPAHDDRTPSLSVALGNEGRILVTCHAGCTAAQITGVLGLTLGDLMGEASNGRRAPAATPKRHGRSFSSQAEVERFILSNAGHGAAIGGCWQYVDEHGALVLCVLRVNLPRGKTYRPIHPLASGAWIMGDPQGPLPLYRLPDIPAHGRVLVAEGEKCVEELVRLGFAATTSSHGARSAAKSNWAPLAGREVVILPDNNDPGRNYASDVGRILRGLSRPASVRMLALPGLGDGEDIVDFVAQRRAAGKDDAAIRCEVEQLVESAGLWTGGTDSSGSGGSRVPAFVPFPVECLPQKVQEIVDSVSKSIGCDPSFVALPILAVAASAIGNSARIEVKEGWTEPPILWVAIVAPSGQQKSPVFQFVTGPTEAIQSRAYTAYKEAQAAYELEDERYKRDSRQWRDDGVTGDPPLKPNEPVPTRYLCDDVTLEALIPILDGQPRGVLLKAEELATWLGSFDQYRSGRGADVARWLCIFGAREITVDRKTGDKKFIRVSMPAVCVVGSIQPGTLRRILEKKHFENGLASRLLFTMPPPRKRRWTDACIPQVVKAEYAWIIDNLYSLELTLDQDGAPVPHVLRMSPAAKALWVQYFNRHAEQQLGLSEELAAAWSKLEGITPRLALILHWLRWACGEPQLSLDLDETSMSWAIAVSDWCAHEVRRVYGALHETEEERALRLAVDLIRTLGGSVSVRDWHRKKTFPSADAARSDLDRLVTAGLGRWERGAVKPGGGWQTEVFHLLDARGSDTRPVGDVQDGRVSESELSEDDGVEFEPDSVEVVEEEVDPGDEQHPLPSYDDHESGDSAASAPTPLGNSAGSDTSDSDTRPAQAPPDGRVSEREGPSASDDSGEWIDL